MPTREVLATIEMACRIRRIVRPHAEHGLVDHRQAQLRAHRGARVVRHRQGERARVLRPGHRLVRGNGDSQRARHGRHADATLGPVEPALAQVGDVHIDVADIGGVDGHLDGVRRGGAQHLVPRHVLAFLGDEDRARDAVAANDQPRDIAGRVALAIGQQLEEAIAFVFNGGVLRPRHPQPRLIGQLAVVLDGLHGDAEAAGLAGRQGDGGGRAPVRIGGGRRARDAGDGGRAVIALGVFQLLEIERHRHPRARGAEIVHRAHAHLRRAAWTEHRPIELRRHQERAARGVHDGVAGDLAAAGIGHLGLDAGAVVAEVLRFAHRNPQRRLAVGVEPDVALLRLLVTVEVGALVAVEALAPAERRVVGLLVHHPVQLPVGHGLAEVVAGLHRDHGPLTLHHEARRRRDHDLELRLAVLLHLERADRLRVAALNQQAIGAERAGGRHLERGRHRAERVDLQRLAEDHLVVVVAGDQLHLLPIERLQGIAVAPAEDGLGVDRLSGAIDRLVRVDVADQFARRRIAAPTCLDPWRRPARRSAPRPRPDRCRAAARR